MNKVYFDTEFEGLFENAGLIAIGLTNQDGSATYYAELSDTYDRKNCSVFCKSIVLPLLEHKNIKTYKELQYELYLWLEQQKEDTVLICDSPRDIDQLYKLFPNGLPKNCTYKVLGLIDKIKRNIKNHKRKLYKQYSLRDHHALDDAIINRIIFEGK